VGGGRSDIAGGSMLTKKMGVSGLIEMLGRVKSANSNRCTTSEQAAPLYMNGLPFWFSSCNSACMRLFALVAPVIPLDYHNQKIKLLAKFSL
jgi:hypothetical protein